jgi:hypothetical protein
MSNGGAFLYSGVLYNVAREACSRAMEGRELRRLGDRSQTGDVLTAVVFSAISLEAYFNELPISLQSCEEFLRDDGVQPPDEQLIGRLRAAGRALAILSESQGTTVECKFQVAYFILRENEVPKGESPFQDFSDLNFVRNKIVHSKVIERFDFTGSPEEHTPHNVVSRLRNKNLLAEDEAGTDFSGWLQRIVTPAVARWACNTAHNVVALVERTLPNSTIVAPNSFFEGID